MAPDLVEPEQLSMRRVAARKVIRSYTPVGARGRSVYIDDDTNHASDGQAASGQASSAAQPRCTSSRAEAEHTEPEESHREDIKPMRTATGDT